MITRVIFDMDGVLSDTQTLHATIESELLARNNVNMTPDEITAKYAGVETKEFFLDLIEGSSKEEIDILINEKWARIAEEAKRGVPAIPHAQDLVKQLSFNFRLGVASASRLNYVQTVIGSLGLAEYFGAITSAQQVARGKPSPDLFLYCAGLLGAMPDECVVIEDGRSGMIAAERAGMPCIGLVKPGTEKNYPATAHVHSLSEVTDELIQSLAGKRL